MLPSIFPTTSVLSSKIFEYSQQVPGNNRKYSPKNYRFSHIQHSDKVHKAFPQPTANKTNLEENATFVLFFAKEYFGIKIEFI